LKGTRLQGELITPTRGVLDCYDHDDFIHARIAPGAPLAQGRGSPTARFETWNDIALHWKPRPSGMTARAGASDTLIVNQAWHPDWSANVCVTRQDERNRLALDCSARELQLGSARLHFESRVGTLGAHVSQWAWGVWLLLTGTLLAIRVWARFVGGAGAAIGSARSHLKMQNGTGPPERERV
jgi:hypothetical protein